MRAYLPGADDAVRFWAKVDKAGDCWLWRSTKDRKGYGLFSVGPKHHESGRRRNSMQAAHRVAYYFANGQIPPGLHVLHRCGSPACVRAEHLFAGTVKENVRHMDLRGRRVTVTKRGAEHGLAVLDEQKVRELVLRYRAGGVTQRQLALAYGVSLATINHIITGRRWSHLDLSEKK